MQLETAPDPIRIIGLPHVLDPTRDRVELTVLPGQTIAEMIDEALPLAREMGASYVRVTVNGHPVEAENWHRVRAKAGMHVLIRIVPQGDALKNVLLIAVTVAAIAAGQFYAANLLGAIGITGAAAAGVPTALATAAISSPIPPGGRVLADALDARSA
ncbi:hypothetical protein MBUL_01447 [Methylobacterium bullatum]|uniref:Uncharacterized protein n=1 Tax=Methylobacterium bullatum TaxID=570505 RepID=A0A679IT33_9HYPH|nr:hypothetical protein MBUL_01447 [Methylobacterium bullatum]